jgi:hypothetical protein
MQTISKMSPEFFLAFLSELGGYEGMTKVWIVMNEGGGGRQDYPDGRRVFTKTETHYSWKGEEEAAKLWDFTQWNYVAHLRIDWGDKKSLSVSHCFTEIGLYGFDELPNIKALPGERPRKIVLNF